MYPISPMQNFLLCRSLANAKAESYEEVVKLPIIRKIVKNDCAVCERKSYCYFGVAFDSFPTLSRVVFDDEGFTSCLKVAGNRTENDEEGG